MFSTSMMASSTTTPTAITNPASTMVFIVPPVQYSTRAAAISDKRDRHHADQRRPPLEEEDTQHQDDQEASKQQSHGPGCPRDSSMKVAGRKMAVSTAIPVRPGSSCFSASSTPRVTSRVLPQGSFSTISMSPGPPLMTASPISCWWSSTTLATSASRKRRQSLPILQGHLGKFRRST